MGAFDSASSIVTVAFRMGLPSRGSTRITTPAPRAEVDPSNAAHPISIFASVISDYLTLVKKEAVVAPALISLRAASTLARSRWRFPEIAYLLEVVGIM
jgi:hypothetical protein